DEERDSAIVVEPAAFRAANRPFVEVPWRSTLAERADWESRLLARIGQVAAVDAASDAAVGAAEDAALPLLRDAFVEAASSGFTATDLVQALSDRLLVDLKTSPR